MVANKDLFSSQMQIVSGLVIEDDWVRFLIRILKYFTDILSYIPSDIDVKISQPAPCLSGIFNLSPEGGALTCSGANLIMGQRSTFSVPRHGWTERM